MTAKRVRRLLAAVVIGGLVFKVVRVLQGPPTGAFDRPSPRPEPTRPAQPTRSVEPDRTAEPERHDQPDDPDEPDRSWVEPIDGTCPDGYPVKGKLRSGIFHVPGGLAYERTRPDRCYPDAQSAEADGLRAAKR